VGEFENRNLEDFFNDQANDIYKMERDEPNKRLKKMVEETGANTQKY
jgi:ferritin-like metal-binding protein YciE